MSVIKNCGIISVHIYLAKPEEFQGLFLYIFIILYYFFYIFLLFLFIINKEPLWKMLAF